MERLSLFTLQGLGNSILAFPIIASLKNRFDLTLHTADKQSAFFYSDLRLANVVLLDSFFRRFTHRARPSDIAALLYPNWRRELWQLKLARAPRKISFLDANYPLTQRIKSEKIEAETIHDIENNFKLVMRLGLPEAYPDIAGFFPERKEKKISIHLTASTPLKYYPKKFWLALIDCFIQEGFEVNLFIGASNTEKVFLKNLLRKLKPTPFIRLHIGKRLSHVAKELANSEIFIGLDSALMHLSAMLDVFTVALWSSADYRRIYPYGNQAHLYIPKETLDAHRFYSKNNAYLKRADYADVLNVVKKKKSPDASIQPKFVNTVRLYRY